MRVHVWLCFWCRLSEIDRVRCRLRLMVRVTVRVRVKSEEVPGTDTTAEQLSP